jgi:hypothetical protein
MQLEKEEESSCEKEQEEYISYSSYGPSGTSTPRSRT